MHMFFGKKTNAKLGDIIIENPKSTIQVGNAKDTDGKIPFSQAVMPFLNGLTLWFQVETVT